MSNPFEVDFTSAAGASEVRDIVWGGEDIAVIEEIAMIYSACKGALYDVRKSGKCSGIDLEFLNREKHQALRGLYAMGVGTEYVDAINDGTYLNK